MRDWTSRKQKEHWQPICGHRLAKGFLKRLSIGEGGGGNYGIAQSEHKPASNNDRFTNRALSFKRTFIKLGLVHIPNCNSCKQASETVSHILKLRHSNCVCNNEVNDNVGQNTTSLLDGC